MYFDIFQFPRIPMTRLKVSFMLQNFSQCNIYDSFISHDIDRIIRCFQQCTIIICDFWYTWFGQFLTRCAVKLYICIYIHVWKLCAYWQRSHFGNFQQFFCHNCQILLVSWERSFWVRSIRVNPILKIFFYLWKYIF